MFYKFPVIEHLDQVREAIDGRTEFIIAEREWGYVANYLVNLIDTFPYPNTRDAATNERYKIRRECRGIKFDLDGKPIARLFHKFHNFGERVEVDVQNVDFNQPFITLDKLDGSMIHPIMLDGKVIVCTKMGITDIATPVQNFIGRSEAMINGSMAVVDYGPFMYAMMENGQTPLFEWCSRKQRIVVDYGEHDYLTLTAIRNIITGEYKSHDEMVELASPFNVPVVNHWPGSFDGIKGFIDQIQDKEGEEGAVLRFDNGHMLKFKNIWYVQLHKTKELLNFEKDVWALILADKHDDAKAFMDQENKDRIDAFADALYGALDATAERLKWEVIAWVDNHGDNTKKFAVDFVNGKNSKFDSHERGLLFKIKNDIDGARDIVHDYIRNNLGTGPKVDAIRHLANDLTWLDF
jgi:RNA ligase